MIMTSFIIAVRYEGLYMYFNKMLQKLIRNDVCIIWNWCDTTFLIDFVFNKLDFHTNLSAFQNTLPEKELNPDWQK